MEASVEDAGNEWTRVTLPRKQVVSASTIEKSAPAFAISALATYYVNFPSVSKLQIHPFTAASSASAETGPVLLFRRGPERKTVKKTEKEFTWALATAAGRNTEEPPTMEVGVQLSREAKAREANIAIRSGLRVLMRLRSPVCIGRATFS
ncbi:hypothetical protein LTR62_002507 [Meristemomyces frigidus]|uniref:FAD-binding 8 domain-containing protein n=1 Tax=Meristemomyces frigidus TaxID=1508187 RepID=A0AAN7T790_9PEZI|nr:hypothetical protein LTR62_002507 [Meristemomyces frigidus]